MPIVNKIKGDLVKLSKQGNFDIIVHCCNCFCTMGAGIAPQIANAFPEARKADLNTEKGDRSKLGNFSVAFNKEYKLWVVNLYGQYRYGFTTDGRLPVDYKAISKGFKKLNKYYGGEDLKFGIPMLGSGLAGGHWDAIEEIINLTTPDLEITLVEYLFD